MAEQEQQEQQPGTGLAVADQGRATTGGMLQAFISALTDPRVDAAKMPVVADTLIKLKDYERQEEFSKAKAAAVASMPIIDKKGRVVIPANRDKGTPERLQSRYSKWEDIHAAIMPILTAHNLVLTHVPGHVDKSPAVAAMLTHANGYSERSDFMPLPIDNSGSKNPTQGVGSALSYGQRYTTILMLNIRQQNVDDDGAATSKPAPARELNEQEELLVSDGRAAAKKGGETYETWFRGLEAPQRGWLVVSGKHDLFKRDAGLK